MPSDDLSEFVIIASFSNPVEANLAKTKLDSVGISSTLLDEKIVQVNWLYSNAVGGVKLQVRAVDRHRALLALEAEDISEEELAEMATREGKKD